MRRNRLALIGIFTLFLAPVLLAVLMHSRWWEYEPAHTLNAGRLVDPPAPLELEGLKAPGKWWVLFIHEARCGSECERQAIGLRQVHLALGRHRAKVNIALLDGTDGIAEQRLLAIYPHFVPIPVESDTLVQLGDAARARGLAPTGSGFLLDPAGNIILAYDPGFDPIDINRDLKRLLTWSNQGE